MPRSFKKSGHTLNEHDLRIIESLIVNISMHGKGLPILQLVEEVGFAHKNVLARLKLLEKNKLVVRKRQGKYTLIYPTDEAAIRFSLLNMARSQEALPIKYERGYIKIPMPRWWQPNFLQSILAGIKKE